MIEPSPPSVTAAEAVRNFAAIRQRASAAPVFITHHGRAAHVLCSADQFRALSDRRGTAGADPVTLDMAQLAAWIDQGLLLVDRTGRIAHANAALLAAVPHDATRLIGHGVFDALPELVGTLAEAYLRRALASREVATFDMASPFHDRAWLRCRLAPIGNAIALLIADITRDMLDLRAAGARDTLAGAVEQNEDIAVVHLSARASIEQADRHFAAWIDVSEAGLIGRPFCDLIDGVDRLAIRALLEAVIGRGESRGAAARLLVRSGESVAIGIGAVRRCGSQGDGGALLMLSRTESWVGDTRHLRQVK